MANLSITLDCQQDCSYCFARGLADRAGLDTTAMSRALYTDVLAFLRRSGIDQVRLLGGEPTVHPDFVWFVDEAERQDFRLLVFSNGLIQDAALRRLEVMPPDRVSVLVNIASGIRATRESAIERLGRRAVLGVTLSGSASDGDALEDAVARHPDVVSVRLGVALPQLNGANFFSRPKDYPRIGLIAVDVWTRMARRAVAVEFDCGFVPCMFPDDTPWASLERGQRPAVGTCCGPVPDILPDGSFIPCYPLASVCRLPWGREPLAADVRLRMADTLRPHRQLGIYRDCEACGWRSAGACTGGCLAAAMLRWRSGRGGALAYRGGEASLGPEVRR